MTIAYDSKASGPGASSAALFMERVEIALTTQAYATASGGIVLDLVGEVDELAGKTIKAVIQALGPGTTTQYLADYQHATDSIRIYESGADGAPLDEIGDGDKTMTFEFLVFAS